MKTSKLKNFFRPTLLKIALLLALLACSDYIINEFQESSARCFETAGEICKENILYFFIEIIFIWPLITFFINPQLVYASIFLNCYILSNIFTYILNKYFFKKEKTKLIISTTFILLLITPTFFQASQIVYNKINNFIESIPVVRDQTKVETNFFQVANLNCNEQYLNYNKIKDLQFDQNNELAYKAISQNEAFLVFRGKEIGYDFAPSFGFRFPTDNPNYIIISGVKIDSGFHKVKYKYNTNSVHKRASLKNIITLPEQNIEDLINGKKFSITHAHQKFDERFQDINYNSIFSDDYSTFTFFKEKNAETPNIILTTCHSIN